MTSTEEMDDDEIEEPGEIGSYVSTVGSAARSSSVSIPEDIKCTTKWRRAPRVPSDFSDCKSHVSSCHDSDYEAWLAKFYEELHKQERRSKFIDKATDTDELRETSIPRVESPALTVFGSTAKSDSTKYWGITEGRRHWPLTKTPHEYLLFPPTHPLLNVSTRYGRYLCILHSASGIPETEHKKRLCAIFNMNLLRAKLFSYQLAKLILCDNLISVSWFDLVTKKVVMTTMCQLLRNQRHLEIVSFENTQLQQLEGIVLLCALSREGGENIKELHIWRMFAQGQCPVLDAQQYLAAQRKKDRLQNANMKYHFVQILNNFTNLTHLSVNYAYLANREGDALLSLSAVASGSLKELRILCLPEERPLITNPDKGVGGYQIKDGVWRRAKELNSRMRAMFVFLNMPQYENIILFLSKNIPLGSFYVSSGIDLKFGTPWEIDTTLLELRNWYATTLESLSLHLWHHRDLLDYVIEYKILDEFPNLLKFEFIGVLKCFTTLDGFCRRLLTKKYKLKHLLFWVEEEYSDSKRRQKSLDKMAEIKQKLPYVHLVRKNGKAAVQGYLGKIWKILERRLNFSSDLIEEDYTAAVLSSKRGLRDVILHPCIISSKDTHSFNFTVPLLNSWYSLYIKDSDEVNSSASYIRNWSIGLWVSTGLVVLIFTLVLYAILNVSFRFLKANIVSIPRMRLPGRLQPQFNSFKVLQGSKYYELRSTNEASLGNCFIIALAAFCSQGCNVSISSASTRVSMLTFLIFGMIMCNSYSALLVSQLTLRERFLPFKNLNEIPQEAREYSLCVRESSYPYKYFKVNQTSTILKRKWARIVNRKPCVEGVIPPDVMCAPQIAFLETPAIMQQSISRNFKCKVTHLRGKYFRVQFSILLRDFTQKARQEINSEIMKYREAGILGHLTKKYVRQDDLMSPADDPELQVTYDHIEGVVLAYLCCVGVSFGILLTEIVIARLTNHFRLPLTRKRINTNFQLTKI